MDRLTVALARLRRWWAGLQSRLRAVGASLGARSDPWRRAPEASIVAVSVVVLVAVLYAGGRVIGLPLPLPGVQRPVAAVHLDTSIPPITRTAVIPLMGSTRGGAAVTVFVDHVRVDTYVTGPDGQFALPATLPARGEHTIRIEVHYGGRRIDEVLESTITWVPDSVAVPDVVGVEWWAEFGGYYLLVEAAPGVVIQAQGATIEPLASERVGPTGRAEYILTDVRDALPTLTAVDQEGVESAPTAPLDLAALALEPPPVGTADRVDSRVTFLIDRREVTRTWVVTLDADRTDLARLTSGSIAPLTFLEDVAGPAGIAPLGADGCLTGTVRAGQSDLELVSAEARLTLVDSFSGVLTQWNGITDSPGLSLCLPRGMPARRDTGFVEVRLRDYLFAGVSIPPTTASTVTDDAGVVEHVYRWDRIPFATNLDLRLGSVRASIQSLIPNLGTSGNVDIVDGPLRAIDAIVWRFIRSFGIVLLLAVAISRRGSALGPRRALFRSILVVALALGLAPAFGRFDLAVRNFSNFPAVLTFEDFSVRLIVAEWAVALLATGAAALAYRMASRWRRELWRASSLALVLAGLGWLAAMTLARLTLSIVSLWGSPGPEWVRLSTWISGLAVLAVPLTYLAAAMTRLSDPQQPAPSRGRRVVSLTIALIAAALLSVPAGVEGEINSTDPAAWAWMRDSIANLAGLAAFIAPVAAFLLVAVVAHHAWPRAASAIVEPDDPTVPEDPGWIGRLVSRGLLPAIAAATFAGFAIRTGGGLQPLALALALAVFALCLRPAGSSSALASGAAAPGSAEPSGTGSTAALAGASPPATVPPVEGPSGSEVEAATGRPGREEEQPVEPAAGPRPAAPIWSNVRFALIWGSVFLIVPLVIYLAQFPISGISREDPLYLQHFLLAIASYSLSWLFIALSFGLAIDHLRAKSGVRNGFLFALAILAATVPLQLLSGLLTVFSPLEVTIWIFDVLTFTLLLGAAFDLRAAKESGEDVDLWSPASISKALSGSGAPTLIAGAGLIVGAIATTIGGLITNQVTQIVTQLVTPFVPLH